MVQDNFPNTLQTKPLTASVVIVTHNRSAFLKLALESVRAQTVAACEVIVIDDASDNSHTLENKKICNCQVKYHYLDTPKGAQFARNYGSKLAQGDILIFLDDDDLFHTNKIEHVLSVFEKKSSIGAVSNAFVATNHGKKRKYISTKLPRTLDELLIENLLGGCSMMAVKKTVFEQVEGFSLDFSSCQDWDLWVKLFNVSQIECLPSPLTTYYVAPTARISTNLKKSYYGRRKFYFKYHKRMCANTKAWNLFILSSITFALNRDLKRLRITLNFLIKSKRILSGLKYLGATIKRAHQST